MPTPRGPSSTPRHDRDPRPEVSGRDEYYIVYHRRPLNETDGNHRQTCIDPMTFGDYGRIKPVKMTFEGVAAVPMPVPTGGSK